jgi:predicted Zn-dependent peptidase
MYVMGGSVDTARCGEALKAMRDQLVELRAVAQGAETVTEEMKTEFDADFAKARRKIINQLLGQSNVTNAVAYRLGNIAMFDLAPDYYDQLLKQVAAASPALVKALLLNELPPEGEVVVLMSDRETMQKAFDENGIEQVKYVEPEVE